jgi:hypothetical protein
LNLLQCLHDFIQAFSLEKYIDSKGFLIEVMIELSRAPLDPQINALTFEILKSLLEPLHGNAAQTSAQILKHLVPSLLLSFGTPGTSIPKWMTEVRDRTVEFLE